MANPSILAAFERMWFHIINALNSKASIDHNHDDQYYTESEVDAIVSAADAHIRTKADLEHNHDVQYEKIGSAKKIVADLIANGQIGGLETESEIISETLAVVEDGTCQIQLPVNLTTGSYYLYIDGTKYEMFCKGGAYLDADGMSIQASGNTVSITWHTSAPDSVTVSMTRAVEIIHTIDAQYIPKLKNELVIEESTTLTYEFDGDPADRFVYGDMLVHISNDTPDVSNFVKAIGVTPTGESLEVTKDFVTISTPEDSNIAGITIPSLNSMIAALVVYGDNANDLPVGLYLACTPTGYCSYLELEQIHRTIDSKFLPDGLATTDYVHSVASTAADAVKNDLLNGAGEAYDTLKELGVLIDENADALEALNTVATGKANAIHTHDASDIASGSFDADMIVGLSAVATSGKYDDLENTPTIPSADGLASILASRGLIGDDGLYLVCQVDLERQVSDSGLGESHGTIRLDLDLTKSYAILFGEHTYRISSDLSYGYSSEFLDIIYSGNGSLVNPRVCEDTGESYCFYTFDGLTNPEWYLCTRDEGPLIAYLYEDRGVKKIDSKFLPDEFVTEKLNGLASEEFVTNAIDTKQDKITGTVGDFVIIGDDGNLTTKTILNASEVKF